VVDGAGVGKTVMSPVGNGPIADIADIAAVAQARTAPGAAR
jgi:hypothetical protein